MDECHERPDYTMVIAILDNESETIDRYTIVTGFQSVNPGSYDMLGLGDDVTSPQGFSQWSEGTYFPGGDNSHLGKEIDWEELPDTHKQHILSRLDQVEL